MAGDRYSLKIPSIMTALVVIASVFATGMLVISYFSVLTPQAALKRGDPVDRVQAVEHLIKQGRSGVPDLVYAIHHYHRETRIASLFGLGRIGLQASEAYDDVCTALRDDDPSVRSVAVATLWQICPDPHRIVPILVPMSMDAHQSVRHSVEKTLQEIGLLDPISLLEFLPRQTEPIRGGLWPIVLKIAKTNPKPETIQFLRSLLDHSNRAIHDEALLFVVMCDRASPDEIRELLSYGETRLASSPPGSSDAAAVDVALQAMTMLGTEAVTFLPDLLVLLDRQEPLEVELTANHLDMTALDDRFGLNARFQKLLAILSLMRTEARSAIPVLEKRLGELHPANRMTVAQTLVDLGGKPELIVPLLLPYLCDEGADRSSLPSHDAVKSYRRARMAASVLMEASPTEAHRHVSRLSQRLENADHRIDKIALSALTGLGPVADRSLADLLMTLIGYPDREVRCMAVETISSMGPKGESAVPSLVARLEANTFEEDPEMSRQIVLAFGQIGPAARLAVPSLLSVIERPEDHVVITVPALFYGDSSLSSRLLHWTDLLRLTAISSLGKIGDARPEVLSVLGRELNASLADRRLAAAKALQSMGPISDSLLDQLVLLLHDDAAAVRVQTLLTIGNLNGNRKRTVSSIERLLSDNNIFVRQAAIMTLGRIGQDAKSVLPQLKSRSDERGRMDGAWYARLVGVSQLPSWFDQKPDFPDRTMDEAVMEAIAAIDRDAN